MIGQGNRCLKVYHIPKEINIRAPLKLPVILKNNKENQLNNSEAECGEFNYYTIHQSETKVQIIGGRSTGNKWDPSGCHCRTVNTVPP